MPRTPIRNAYSYLTFKVANAFRIEGIYEAQFGENLTARIRTERGTVTACVPTDKLIEACDVLKKDLDDKENRLGILFGIFSGRDRLDHLKDIAIPLVEASTFVRVYRTIDHTRQEAVRAAERYQDLKQRFSPD